MLASIPYTQFQEWQAYSLIEPWGQDRADLRAAMVASVTANAAGAKTEMKDFMPDYESVVERMIEEAADPSTGSGQAPEDEAQVLFKKMMAWHTVLGGTTA